MDVNPIVLAALVSGGCATITAIGVTWINKRSEAMTKRREMALRFAMEHWTKANEQAKYLSGQFPGSAFSTETINVHVAHAVLLCDLFDNVNLTPKRVSERIKRMEATIEAVRRMERDNQNQTDKP